MKLVRSSCFKYAEGRAVWENPLAWHTHGTLLCQGLSSEYWYLCKAVPGLHSLTEEF